MASSIETGLFLLMVGMLTVFSVLAVVVVTGRVLIIAVNGRDKKRVSKPKTHEQNVRQDASELNAETIAVITAAVLNSTNGMGRIQSIQRVE